MSALVTPTGSKFPLNYNRLEELARALKPSNKSKHYHISFILKANRILSIGINNERKTNPNNLRYGYRNRDNLDISGFVGTHSERAAIQRLNASDCFRYRLVNIRINHTGAITNSRPCKGCQNLIREVKFKEVWYSNDFGIMEKL
jgi:deoxycytidylate deaminase